MNRLVSLLFVGLVLGTAACRSDTSIEVINTSGAPYLFIVSGNQDVFWTDTVPSGNNHCWLVPDVARNQLVRVMANDLNTKPLQSYDYTEAWMDSLSLNRSWRVQIHSSKFLEASDNWKTQRRSKEAEVSAWYRKAIAANIRGVSPATLAQIEVIRDRMLSEGPIQPGAPHYAVNAEISESNSCSNVR